MDEHAFAVSFNDVDLCLRLRQLGYRILWTPHARLIHWESATPGLYPTTRSIRRLREEEQELRRRWGSQLGEDRAYSPNLSLIDGSCSLAFPPRVVSPWRRGGKAGK